MKKERIIHQAKATSKHKIPVFSNPENLKKGMPVLSGVDWRHTTTEDALLRYDDRFSLWIGVEAWVGWWGRDD